MLLPRTTTFTEDGKIDTFTVPLTGDYDITAIGATGGAVSGGGAGGAGGEVEAEFHLVAGEVIEVAVGQVGFSGKFGGGGGGGSFVVLPGASDTTDTLLVVAGGGGGGGDMGGGLAAAGSAAPGNSGGAGSGSFDAGAGGTIGRGGGGSQDAGGGGGFDGAGGNDTMLATAGGGAFEGSTSGPTGGVASDAEAFPTADGGYGGGGGSNGFEGGGGGGYSGGGAGGEDSGGGGGGWALSRTYESLITVDDNYNTSGNGSVTFTAVTLDPPCYCRGARILTERGQVAVEALAIGGLVVTATGGRRPIRWIGHRSLDITRHPDPKAVWPICVSAGAFGEGKPSRDLWLSPGHNVAVEGALIPIGALQNGKSVVQHRVDSVEYWHVELDEHDIILAEDLPAESYLDCGNRTGFVNGGAFVEAHPDFKPRHWRDTCLPLVQEGPEVVRAKTLLLERLEALGHVRTSEADVHMIVDGKRVQPIELGAMRLAFSLPPGGLDIRLVSRTFIPAHIVAASSDSRTLGLCVSRLQINGENIALDDESLDAEGWSALERPSGSSQRWTTGDTPLPSRTRFVVFDLAGSGRYWQEPENNVLALFG